MNWGEFEGTTAEYTSWLKRDYIKAGQSIEHELLGPFMKENLFQIQQKGTTEEPDGTVTCDAIQTVHRVIFLTVKPTSRTNIFMRQSQ